MSESECDNNVFKYGVSCGLHAMTKQEADEACRQATEKTGELHDWHYIGGRVHIKRLVKLDTQSLGEAVEHLCGHALASGFVLTVEVKEVKP